MRIGYAGLNRPTRNANLGWHLAWEDTVFKTLGLWCSISGSAQDRRFGSGAAGFGQSGSMILGCLCCGAEGWSDSCLCLAWVRWGLQMLAGMVKRDLR